MAFPPPRNLFVPFHQILSVPYTQIRSQPIPLDILVPKSVNASSGPRPVLVNLHGGGLLTGSRLFEPFWAAWIVDEALAQNAIIVTPDYPLAPESKAPEIVTALRSFMDWLASGALQQELDARASELGSSVKADVSKLLLAGESAGGWAALHAALAYPDMARALVLRFPMVDLEDPYWFKPTGLKEIFGMPIAGPETLDQHISAMVPGKIVCTGGPDRMPMSFATIASGRVMDAVGTSTDAFPLRSIRAGTKLPKKVWIIHGQDDTVVPLKGSEHTASLIKEHVPETEVFLDTRPGDHGFEGEWTTATDPVIGERLAWLRETWLA